MDERLEEGVERENKKLVREGLGRPWHKIITNIGALATGFGIYITPSSYHSNNQNLTIVGGTFLTVGLTCLVYSFLRK